MSGAVLRAVFDANLAAAAAILLVILLRPAIRSLFGAGAAYMLWFAPLLAAAVTFAPRAEIGPMTSVVALQRVGEAASRAGATALAPLEYPLLAAWLAGVAVSLVVMLVAQRRFTRALGPLGASPGCLVQKGAHPQAGPAVVGALRPRIVVPSDFETSYDAEERELILAHEMTHLARRDSLVNAAAATALCLAWFNPLAHLGVRMIRIDQEMACDARVLANPRRSRRRYAELLLRGQLAGDPLPLGCRWPATGVGPLRARIAMLGQATPAPIQRRVGGFLAAVLVLGAGGAAWAMQGRGGTADLVLEPRWIDRPSGADLVAAYPPAAEASGLGGRALLQCIVGGDGRLQDCRVLRAAAEDGTEPGFGYAALQLASAFRMTARDAQGNLTAGESIRIPFLFVAPKAEVPGTSE